ncbi:MAG TPA: SDR family oxidoreductase [Spongiibacteraceae bacterium]|jgi:NAD(P)-dependent dehydrogenase (short-subunit alcohol dehydrogenase family)|nr:SDR family oxidoreductase [Spongiibacteraceae bacterium]HUH37143.1 SDR family oxidoreductase [Spongiibacteraceae bacterium]
MRQLAIITGASKGIGLATAARFAEQGYAVVNLSRSPIPLAGAQQINADFCDPAWVAEAQPPLAAAMTGAERIVLIHNAAILRKDAVGSVDAHSLAEVLQVNVVAAAQLNQLVLPFMKPGSSILYVGSTLSEKAVSNSCSYVTSKHAQLGLMRSTCQDLVDTGIHTACICPGFTDTEMLRSHIGTDPAVEAGVVSGMAVKRLVRPEEIAETLWFCANHPVINGALIHANLGQVQR